MTLSILPWINVTENSVNHNQYLPTKETTDAVFECELLSC